MSAGLVAAAAQGWAAALVLHALRARAPAPASLATSHTCTARRPSTPPPDELFNKSTFEPPVEVWEKPSGLGLCPLSLLFTICSSMHHWLNHGPDNIVVRGGLAAGAACFQGAAACFGGAATWIR